MKRVMSYGATLFALLTTLVVGSAVFEQPTAAQGRGAAAGGAPAYRVNALWPQPFPDEWVLGSITGVATDAQNNVWVAHRGNESLEANERGMVAAPGGLPSSSVCCMAAPYILRFDPSGKITASWGGPSQNYVWPQATGGIAVDAKGNVWVTGAGLEPPPPGTGRGRGGAPPAGAPGGRGAPAEPPKPPPADAHVLKFAPDGRHLLTIGTPGNLGGADSQTGLNRPSAIAYDAAANEVFVADMGNRRVVVFDADKGAYRRHWFAYGEKTAGAAPGPYNASEQPAKSFRDITCIEVARDGMVYVCDKSSNRIQVFDKTGKFVKEGFVAKDTGGGILAGSFGVLNAAGAVWDVSLSNDQQQRYLFVADGMNKKIRVLNRDTLTEVGAFGSGGRYPGQFLVVNSVATDGQGNIYTGETHHGKRVQKFVQGR
jgi:DNA-binding beta-propeller fold protein YncE